MKKEIKKAEEYKGYLVTKHSYKGINPLIPKGSKIMGEIVKTFKGNSTIDVSKKLKKYYLNKYTLGTFRIMYEDDGTGNY